MEDGEVHHFHPSQMERDAWASANTLSPQIGGAVGFISTSQSYLFPQGRIGAIFDTISKSGNDHFKDGIPGHLLVDFLNAAEGKPEAIEMGVQKLRELDDATSAGNFNGVREMLYDRTNEGLASAEYWKRGFKYLYEGMLKLHTPEGREALEQSAFDPVTKANLKKGYASYFYKLALGKLANENNGSVVLLNAALATLVENKTLYMLQQEGGSLTEDEKKTLRTHMLENAIYKVEKIVKEKLPPNLVDCFDYSTEQDGFHVNYLGLLNEAHDTLKALEERNKSWKSRYTGNPSAVNEALIEHAAILLHEKEHIKNIVSR